MAIRYDRQIQAYYDDQTGEWVDEPARDHSQNPWIGIVLLVAVLGAAYLLSGGGDLMWVVEGSHFVLTRGQ